MTKQIDRAAIAAENEIYIRLGRALLAMLAQMRARAGQRYCFMATT
jgi:hypothetical protein